MTSISLVKDFTEKAMRTFEQEFMHAKANQEDVQRESYMTAEVRKRVARALEDFKARDYKGSGDWDVRNHDKWSDEQFFDRIRKFFNSDKDEAV